MADEEPLEEVTVTGRDVYSGAANFAPFDLGGMAAAIAAYYDQMAAAAAAAYVPPPEEVIVQAPRPAPEPAPRPAPRPPPPLPPPPSVVAAPAPPEQAFVAPLPLQEIVVQAKTPVRPPLTRPTPARIPIGPALLLGLVPTYLQFLSEIDEAATARAGERLKLPPRRPPRTTGTGEPPPDPFRYGRPDPWSISGLPLPDRERRPSARPGVAGSPIPSGVVLPDLFDVSIPEITVTGRAPRPVPAPTWWQPAPIPGVDPTFQPFPQPSEPTQPKPKPVGSPIGAPTASPLPDPLEVPFPEPAPRVPTRPRPGTIAPPGIADPTLPGGGPAVLAEPEALPIAPPLAPPTRADSCECAKKKPKKKKPRTVCYRGTYTERSTGLSKRRKIRVNCKTGKELKNADDHD